MLLCMTFLVTGLFMGVRDHYKNRDDSDESQGS